MLIRKTHDVGRRPVALGQAYGARSAPVVIEELIAVQRETPERGTPIPAVDERRAA